MGGGTEETENIEATADAEAPVVQVEEKQTLAREGERRHTIIYFIDRDVFLM